MKHINITNWQGNITDWTKFNYIYGGLDETIADKVNLSIPGTNLRNYFKKSDNLINLSDKPSTTTNGITYKVENGVITLNGTASTDTTIRLQLLVPLTLNGNYILALFNTANVGSVGLYDGKNFALGGGTTSANTTKSGTLSNYNALYFNTWISKGSVINATCKPMLVKGSTAPTTYEPYGSMVLVENVGRILGSTYKNDITTTTTLGGLKCTVIQTNKDFVKDNFKTITAKNNLNLTNVSANVQWNSTQVNVLAGNSSQRILINFDQSLTEEEMIEKAKTLVLDYKLITPKVTVFNQVDLGSLIWNYTSAGSLARFWTDNLQTIAKAASASWEKGNISTPGYTNHSWNEFTSKELDMDSAIREDGVVGYRNLQYTTTQAFKTAMNGVILIYEAKDTPSANMLGMVKPSDPAPTAIEDSMSLDELLEPANEER